MAAAQPESDEEYFSAESDHEESVPELKGISETQAESSTSAQAETSPDGQADSSTQAEGEASASATYEAQKGEPESDAEEEILSPDEIEERKAKAQVLKEEGNNAFKAGQSEEALEKYTSAIAVCPRCCASLRAVIYANAAACLVRLDKHEEAVKKCTKALKYDEQYIKALLRRAASLEKLERLEEALKDYHRILELDKRNVVAIQAAMRLPEQIKEQQEKLKEEMLGKLKELGNAILKPFGLSTNNFQLKQDPKTGGYSMNFSH